jgi:allophanate hydrolase subunit 2
MSSHVAAFWNQNIQGVYKKFAISALAETALTGAITKAKVDAMTAIMEAQVHRVKVDQRITIGGLSSTQKEHSLMY